MRMCAKNFQKLKYALFLGEVEEYALDDGGNRIINYVDADGNIYYQKTGDTYKSYSTPTDFLANFVMSGGDAENAEFGIDVSEYDAIITVVADTLPLTETSLIWKDSEVGYTDTNDFHIDPKSADYRVIRVSKSLNYTKYVLKAIVK